MEPATPASPPGLWLRSLRRLLVGLAVAATVVATVPAAAAADTATRLRPVDDPSAALLAGPMFHEGIEVDQPPVDGAALDDTALDDTALDGRRGEGAASAIRPDGDGVATGPTEPADRSGSAATDAVEALTGYTGPVNSANARFVVAGYQQLIGRDPDTGGLDFHLGRIAAGGDRSRLGFAHALLFSAEGSRNEVTRAYDDILGRSPETVGADYWTIHLQGHGVADLQVLLLASDEYVARSGGTETTWLQALYQQSLGRSADQAGLGYWLERRSAGVPRVLVAAAIHQSTEALAGRAGRLYQDVLGRGASQAEIDGMVAALRVDDDRTIRARLFASDEAFEPYLHPVVS